jgi:hypothetical protein
VSYFYCPTTSVANESSAFCGDISSPSKNQCAIFQALPAEFAHVARVSGAHTHHYKSHSLLRDALAQSSNDFEFIAKRGNKTNSSQTLQNYSQARFYFAESRDVSPLARLPMHGNLSLLLSSEL